MSEISSADRTGRQPIRRALVSVYDKSGITELAPALHAAGVEIVSTGSTAATIAAAGIPVTGVETVTGFPECLDGRVKTLHPKVHAGILADRRRPEHVAELADLGVEPFDLIVANLYPFTDTVASGASTDECIEQIDIGGPTMVRAAAKNHHSVAVVTDPGAYASVIGALGAGGFDLAARRALAARAFRHTASYDVAVATWLGGIAADEAEFPAWRGQTWTRSATLRYGENPHQSAALYTDGSGSGLAGATQLHGKEMSYNNYVDADAAWRAAHDHGELPTVAVIKHANPCGVAVADTIAQAHAQAHATDPVSAFGGVIAANRPVTREMAGQVADVFTEVILAPGYEPAALDILTAKKNIRILTVDEGAGGAVAAAGTAREISGGLLVQDVDNIDAAGDEVANWTLAAGEAADAGTLADLVFAWRAVRAVKSNAILLASGGAAVGIGMGQVNRVDSCALAVTRAGDRAQGSVAASDAFFPFADGVEFLIAAGVRAVVQPGGSVRDQEVIDAANAAGVTMYFTGTRHFAH